MKEMHHCIYILRLPYPAIYSVTTWVIKTFGIVPPSCTFIKYRWECDPIRNSP